MLQCLHACANSWLLCWLEKPNSDLSHGFPIKALDFGKLYRDDLAGKGMTDLAVWSERKTNRGFLQGSAHTQENSYQYLEGLAYKEAI